MYLKELRSLLILAETGSFTHAAEHLHLSTAAVHGQLKVLESSLGVQLYIKVGRKVRLTQVAHKLLPEIRVLLEQYEEILKSVEELKKIKRGSLRVGTGPTFSSYVLPHMIREYSLRHPKDEIFVDVGHSQQMFNALSNEQLDAIILVQSELLNVSHLSVRAAWDFEIVLISNINAHHRHCPLSALKKLPFILYREGTFFESLIDNYFIDYHFEPRVTMRFDNGEAIKAMIVSGLGISMLPMWMVQAEVEDKSLALIRQQEPPLYAKLVLVTRKQKRLSQSTESFVEIVRNGEWRSKCQMTSQAL